jgi:hypothetical protein
MPSGGFGGMPSGGFGGMPSGGFGGMPSGGASGMPSGGFGGMPSGGMGGGMPGAGSGGATTRGAGNSGGGQRGGMQRNLPKDEQDRMLFDGQASTFFSFLIEKIGIEKVKALIKQVQEGKLSREFLAQADIFGNNFGKLEEDWTTWVKAQQPPPGLRNPGSF